MKSGLLKHTTLFRLLAQTYQEFSEDKASVFAAALAFFTTFSIAQISFLFVGVISLVLGKSAAEGTLYNQLNSMMGSGAARLVQNLIRNTNNSGGGFWATVIGSVTLFVSATTVVAQLKDSLNTIWGLKPAYRGMKNVYYIIWSRVLGFVLIVVAAVFFLIFLIATSVLYSIGSNFEALGVLADVLIRIGYYILFFLMMFLFFAFIYKYLPDAQIRWQNVLAGALGTSLLFVLGTVLIGLYLGTFGGRSAFGTAGSFVLILLWVFYSAQVFLFGAEFTQVYARYRGDTILPAAGMVRR